MNKELKKVKKEYNDNFEMLMATAGTKDHWRYVRRERKLYSQEIAELKKLNLLYPDPCPVAHSGKVCYACDGYFKIVKWASKSVNYFCKATDKGAVLCNVKEKELWRKGRAT